MNPLARGPVFAGLLAAALVAGAATGAYAGHRDPEDATKSQDAATMCPDSDVSADISGLLSPSGYLNMTDVFHESGAPWSDPYGYSQLCEATTHSGGVAVRVTPTTATSLARLAPGFRERNGLSAGDATAVRIGDGGQAWNDAAVGLFTCHFRHGPSRNFSATVRLTGTARRPGTKGLGIVADILTKTIKESEGYQPCFAAM